MVYQYQYKKNEGVTYKTLSLSDGPTFVQGYSDGKLISLEVGGLKAAFTYADGRLMATKTERNNKVFNSNYTYDTRNRLRTISTIGENDDSFSVDLTYDSETGTEPCDSLEAYFPQIEKVLKKGPLYQEQ